MIKNRDLIEGKVVRIRTYKKKFPEHWREREDRKNHAGKLVTIMKIGNTIGASFGNREILVTEIYLSETTYTWYSDDIVKANRIRGRTYK